MRREREEIADWKALLKIDRDALDDALIGQPVLYQRVARAYARAVSDRDSLKEEIKRVKARAALDVRRRQEKKGGDTREKALEALVEVDASVAAAVDEYLQAAKRAADLEADRDAFQQRSYVLKDLASLWLGGYFATSSVRGSVSNEVQQEQYERRRTEARRKRTPV